MSGISFRGTSVEQDSRFGDKNKKLQQTLTFPDIYSRPVHIDKVNVSVLKPWVTERVTQLMGVDDEVISMMVLNSLETPPTPGAGARSSGPDPKELQINLTGFMGAQPARVFTAELWEMLVTGSTAPQGISPKLIAWQRARSGVSGDAEVVAAAVAGLKARLAALPAAGSAAAAGGFTAASAPAPTAAPAAPSSVVATGSSAAPDARAPALGTATGSSAGTDAGARSAAPASTGVGAGAGTGRDRTDRDRESGYGSGRPAAAAAADAAAPPEGQRRKRRWDN
jgi:hypothetical protein